MLIELGHSSGATIRDPVQRGLTDVPGHPESCSGQRMVSFCHITTITGNK